MHPHLTHHVALILLAMLLAACNLPSGTTPADTHAAATLARTAISLSTPVETAVAAVLPTAEATLSPEAYFQTLVKGGRVAYPHDYPENLMDAPDPSAICVMDAGWSARLCTPPLWYLTPLSANWSPLGDRLLINNNARALQIWTLGGGIETVLTGNWDGLLLDPDWSPDGKTIVYVSNAAHRKAGDENLFDIFAVNVEDSKVSWMTTRQAADSWSPRFSPDGSQVAYISASILTYPDGTTKPSIYQVTLQDMNDWTKPPVAITTGEEYGLTKDSTLAWSPDGSRILFSGRRLYQVNVDGSGTRQVSGTDFGKIRDLTFLSDGQAALINNDLFVELATGDSTKLSLPVQPWYMKWVFPRGGAALQPLPEPNCAADWSSLFSGATAVVLGGPDDPPNRVRSGPGKDYEVVYQIYPETQVKVLEGPVCADGLVFWKVENAQIPGGSGWTAEGDFSEYWMWLSP